MTLETQNKGIKTTNRKSYTQSKLKKKKRKRERKKERKK
jgi:hypothetical protein